MEDENVNVQPAESLEIPEVSLLAEETPEVKPKKGKAKQEEEKPKKIVIGSIY